jgi:hypothetical protein
MIETSPAILGNIDWIFQVQMDGKVIGLWTPDADIDWSEDLKLAVTRSL